MKATITGYTFWASVTGFGSTRQQDKNLIRRKKKQPCNYEVKDIFHEFDEDCLSRNVFIIKEDRIDKILLNGLENCGDEYLLNDFEVVLLRTIRIIVVGKQQCAENWCLRLYPSRYS